MWKSLLISGFVAIGIIACSAEDRAQMEADKIASFDLSPSQQEIMEALVTGYKDETGMPLLKSQDYARSACYAKKVNMPSRYKKAHLLYLANYTEADKDFYPYFKRHGINDTISYEMSERFREAWDKCSVSGALKERLGKN